MKCTACLTNEAIYQLPYGYLPCKACQLRQRKYKKPGETIEVVPQSVKEDRKRFGDDIRQPFRGGILDKKYLKKYGTKGIKVTKQDIKEAKDVWRHDYYHDEG